MICSPRLKRLIKGHPSKRGPPIFQNREYETEATEEMAEPKNATLQG